MSRDWTFYLEDIAEAAEKILAYSEQVDYEEFSRKTMVYDAVVRNLEVIGEASKKLPDQVLAEMPEIEWRKVIGLRDVIAHGYFGLNVDVLWDVVQNRIPALRTAVTRVLNSTQSR
jgi:uncharacterized protein with HEPN domain